MKGVLALTQGEAQLAFEPSQVAIGQPFVCTLSVAHDRADALPKALPSPFTTGEDWILLEGPVTRITDVPTGGVRTEVRWTFMALQPGSFQEDYSLTLKRGAPVEVRVPTLEVAAELTEFDEAPRPLAEVLPAPEEDASPLAMYLSAGGLLALLLVWFLWRQSRRNKASFVPTPAETPSELLTHATWEEARARDILFDWHRELRSAMDQRLGCERASLPEEVWLQETQADVQAGGPISEDSWRAWSATLAQLEHLKYAQDLPSRLTGEDLQTKVRALALGLQSQGKAVGAQPREVGA